jgi:hypothetical protein
MGKKFYDYGIRPRGSPELSYDPFIMSQMLATQGEQQLSSKVRKERVAKVFNFILKTALTILPPKQRKIFYSVWVRSEGKMNKGVMDFARKTGRSHYTFYNNLYKSQTSVRNYLDKTGYTDQIIKYLKGQIDELDTEGSDV